MKLGRDEVLMVLYKCCCCFSARYAQVWIQDGAKIGHGGPLLQETSSSDRKAPATNQMDSNDLDACGKKCCYFWFHSIVKFLTRFWRLFWLIFCVFLCNFYRFLWSKELCLHLCCVISMFLRGRMLLSKISMLEEFLWFFKYLFRWMKGVALMHVHVFVWEHIVSLPPWGRRGFKSRIRPPYPQRVVKGD